MPFADTLAIAMQMLDALDAAQVSTATRDRSRILIGVSPDAAKGKGEIRLLFGWQDAPPQGKQ